jgi:hypothetical protein
MHILFVDESGSPPKAGSDQPRYFVVGGISIPESVWRRLHDAVQGLKIRRKIRGEIKWRYFSPSNEDPDNPMRKMPFEDRNHLRTELYTLICSESSVRTMACVTSAKAAYGLRNINCQQDLYHATYKPITERFQYYLQDLSRQVGRKEYGIIVGDHRGRQDDHGLRAHHQKLLFSKDGFTSAYDNLIESLFLQPSHLSIGIQLADMVAGAVWRKYERDDDRWFCMLRPSLRCDKHGTIDGYGIVKMPKVGWI